MDGGGSNADFVLALDGRGAQKDLYRNESSQGTALLLRELEDGPDREYKERLIKGATAIMYGGEHPSFMKSCAC